MVLPVVEHYQPTDTGESPLANIPEWVNTTCPRCGGPARRETDTMPNWAGSDWYFLRFTRPAQRQAIADLEKLRYWMPVDLYHRRRRAQHPAPAVFALYLPVPARHRRGAGEIPEPYRKRMSHGVILGPDGQRMSKTAATWWCRMNTSNDTARMRCAAT